MATGYASHLDNVKEKQSERVKSAQCLPEIPPPADQARRDACEFDPLLYLNTYCKSRYPKAFGEPHLDLIESGKESILYGGLFARAMQRGGGKTTINIDLCQWAVSYAHIDWIVLIGSTFELAKTNLMEPLQSQMMYDELWGEDFPEIAIPFRALEGEARRCKGQRDEDGEHTRIQWGSDKIVTAAVGYKTDELIVSAHGITGSFHGLRYARRNGEVVRPAHALIDDPQTMESAESSMQSAKRLRIINSGILGLAGPGTNMAAVISCTKMFPNCLSSQALDRNKNPEWHGKTFKMVDPMPDRMDLWAQYAEIRAERLREDGPRSVEDAYLKENWEDMHAGAKLSWPERINDGDKSALQTAMNFWCRNPEMFASEMQNEPLGQNIEVGGITPEIVLRQIGGYSRGTAPIDATGCVASIDCHDDLLYWVLMWYNSETFTCGISEYGTWPHLPSRNFTRGRTATDTVMEAAREGIAGEEGILRHALKNLIPIILESGVTRADGTLLPVGRLIVDAGFRRDTAYGAIDDFGLDKTLGLFGRVSGAKNKPLNDATKQRRKKKRGRRLGLNWYTDRVRGEPEHMVIDTYFWKSFLSSRLRTPIGNSGSMSLYKETMSHHYLLTDHLTAEYPTTVSTELRTVEEWANLPGRSENHWLDCIVYALAAASYQGAHLDGAAADSVKKKRKTFNPPTQGRR